MRPRLTTRAVLVPALAAMVACGSPDRQSVQDPALVDTLMAEMETVFAQSRGMVEHTQTVHGYAVDIQDEEGGDLAIVRAAAILHDIGIPRAREVHGSSAGRYQELEGPPIAREILVRHGFPADFVDHVCGIVANHHSDEDPEIVDTIEFMILWDADWLVNFPGRHRQRSVQEKEEAIEDIFKTGAGKRLARQMFLE